MPPVTEPDNSRSVTVKLSKVKARSIVETMVEIGTRSLSRDIEKALHEKFNPRTLEWETSK